MCSGREVCLLCKAGDIELDLPGFALESSALANGVWKPEFEFTWWDQLTSAVAYCYGSGGDAIWSNQVLSKCLLPLESR